MRVIFGNLFKYLLFFITVDGLLNLRDGYRMKLSGSGAGPKLSDVDRGDLLAI